jgi:peroxiredoxin
MDDQSHLEYGKLAPSFELTAIDGQTYTRQQFRGKSGLVLLFFLPTPEAQLWLKLISRDEAEYKELNAQILGIGRASRDELAPFAAPIKLPFPLLVDPQGETWTAYAGTSDPGYGVFVLDMYGGLEAKAVSDCIDKLPNAATILEWTRSAQYRCSI